MFIDEIENLVFEGGGVKGAGYIGALEVLEEAQVLPKIKRLVGTSAGAIIATLLAVGYTISELKEIMLELDFTTFQDDSINPVKDFITITSKFGLYPGHTLAKWLMQLIEAKTGDGHMTFADLAHLAEENPIKYKKLYIVVTCVNSIHKMEICSHEHRHNLWPLWLAVRASAAIPFLFMPVKLTAKDPEFEDRLYVDGACSSNYKIDLFKTPTLGLRLDTKNFIKHEEIGYSAPPRTFFPFIAAIWSTMMEQQDITFLNRTMPQTHQTIFIDTLHIKSTSFSITTEEKQSLMESGRKAVQEFIAQTKIQEEDRYHSQLENIEDKDDKHITMFEKEDLDEHLGKKKKCCTLL